MSRTLLWTPPSGDPITFESTRGPLVLVSLDGESNALPVPSGSAAPRQIGLTPTGVVVGGRTLKLKVGIVGSDEADREEDLASLIAAWTAVPPRIGERPTLGTVTYTKPWQDPVQIEAIPSGGPIESFMDATREMAIYDVSLWCPDPRWTFVSGEVEVDVSDAHGGAHFPIHFPLSMEEVTIGASFTNPGNTYSALRARIHGAYTGAARLSNTVTGETIEITGDLNADQYIEISTEFGNKYVTLVDADGTETNALDRYNLSTSTFFQIPAGDSFLEFEADNNISGYAEVFYTPALSAV